MKSATRLGATPMITARTENGTTIVVLAMFDGIRQMTISRMAVDNRHHAFRVNRIHSSADSECP